MHDLIANLHDYEGRVLVETVIGDLQLHVIGKEREFFGYEVNSSLFDQLAASTDEYYRAIYLGFQVWNDLDNQIQVKLAEFAAAYHDVLSDVDKHDETERYSKRFTELLANRFAAIRSHYYLPIISVIGSILYVRKAGLYDEAPETSQKRLDLLFAEYKAKTESHTQEQIDLLRTAIKQEASKSIAKESITEIDNALKNMNWKAILALVSALVVALSAILFTFLYQDVHIEGSYQIASSIVRRVTVATMALLAIGLLIRLFRSYVSSIEGLKHKRRLLKSFGELLVMGGTENSQYVSTQLIAIIARNDFALQTSDKSEDGDASIVAGLVSAVQRSTAKAQ